MVRTKKKDQKLPSVTVPVTNKRHSSEVMQYRDLEHVFREIEEIRQILNAPKQNKSPPLPPADPVTTPKDLPPKIVKVARKRSKNKVTKTDLLKKNE